MNSNRFSLEQCNCEYSGTVQLLLDWSIACMDGYGELLEGTSIICFMANLQIVFFGRYATPCFISILYLPLIEIPHYYDVYCTTPYTCLITHYLFLAAFLLSPSLVSQNVSRLKQLP